jgi:hypothetical protein
MALETVRGTAAAAPVIFIPVKNPKIQPVITEIPVDLLIGSMVAVDDQVPTVRHDEYSFTTLAYVDTLPAHERRLLGSTDVITGAGPYTHVLSLLNNDPTNGNQPPSYTFFDWDGYQLRTMAGGMIDELDFKFTATGLVEVTVKILCLPYVATGTAPTAAFSTVVPAPAWSVVSSMNSITTTPIVDGALTLKRGAKALHTLGQAGPYKIWANVLDLAVTLTVINQADTEQALYLLGTSFPLSWVFTPPTSPTLSFKFEMGTVKAKQAHQERGSDGVIVTMLDLQPIPNAANAGAGGVSPLKFTAVTAQALTY